MNLFLKKIIIPLGFITLIILSVIPVFVYAQEGGPAVNTPSTQEEAKSPASNISMGGIVGGAISGLFDIQGAFLRIPLFVVMKITAGLLGMAGLLLDEVMVRTVVNMSAEIGKITAINDVWRIIRDLVNMSFIFILLYHGIRMVLGLGDAGVKKIIVGIVTTAILINFSLLFTKVIIDASNVVTLGFYNSISAVGGGGFATGENKVVTTSFNFGFSGAFMKPLGITGMFDTSGFNQATNFKFGENGNMVIIYLGSILFMLITLFTFMVVSVLFIARFVAFIILLIMSPVAFLSIGIPGLDKLKSKYWGTLSSQALFGPLYMFYSWLILRLMGPGGLGSSQHSIGEALANPSRDTVSVIINFIILIGLLITSVIEAKKQATSGGLISSKMLDKGTGYLGSAIFGGAGFAGRYTLGRWATKISEDPELQKKADMGERGAQLKLAAAKFGAKSSFDARNTKIFEKITGDTSGLGAIGSFGKGMPWDNKIGDGGYKAIKKANKDADKPDIDEIVDRYKKKKDWATIAEFMSKQKDSNQSYIYEKLSPRDRIAIDEALDTRYSTTNYTNPVSTYVRGKLTLEEKEKTEEAGKKAAKTKRDESQIKLIDELVTGTPSINPATGVAYTYDDLLLGSGRAVFSPKNARNLSINALNDPNVIERLKPQHLADIMANNDDLDDATIRNIVRIIETGYSPASGGRPATPARYTYQPAQYAYINKAQNSDNWHI